MRWPRDVLDDFLARGERARVEITVATRDAARLLRFALYNRRRLRPSPVTITIKSNRVLISPSRDPILSARQAVPPTKGQPHDEA
jgi:hypothetical protein